jgi:hypothetical protein
VGPGMLGFAVRSHLQALTPSHGFVPNGHAWAGLSAAVWLLMFSAPRRAGAAAWPNGASASQRRSPACNSESPGRASRLRVPTPVAQHTCSGRRSRGCRNRFLCRSLETRFWRRMNESTTTACLHLRASAPRPTALSCESRSLLAMWKYSRNAVGWIRYSTQCPAHSQAPRGFSLP